MERLTKRNEQNTGYYYPKCFEKCDGIGNTSKCDTCDITSDICERLGQYEDAEEQGLILRVPCKAGTTEKHLLDGMKEDIVLSMKN